MNILQIKSGTKQEIVEYVRSKVSRIIMDITTSAGGSPETFSPGDFKEGELVEIESNPIEHQIDEWIKQGSPLVVVSLAGWHGVGTYQEQFLVADYANVKVDMEIERLDNPELNRRSLKYKNWIIQV